MGFFFIIITHYIHSFFLFFVSFINRISIREQLAYTYIKGEGIEIGALNRPLPLFHHAKVSYVDRISAAGLREHYPELQSVDLTEPDIIDDGEYLTSIPDERYDFVIANHFLEHCENPIMAIKSFLRVLKRGGILFLAVPDKEKTFDRNRDVTTWDHLEQDFISGPELSRHKHYYDFARNVMHQSEEECSQVVEDLMEKGYSIHFHVWDTSTFLEFLGKTWRKECFNLIVLFHHSDEFIIILQKD